MTTVTAFFLAAAALAVQEASATTYGYCYDGWGRRYVCRKSGLSYGARVGIGVGVGVGVFILIMLLGGCCQRRRIKKQFQAYRPPPPLPMQQSDNPYANNPPPPTDGTYGSYSQYGGAGPTAPETAYTGDGKATSGGEAASYYGSAANPSNNYTSTNSYSSPSGNNGLEAHSYEYEQAAANGQAPAAPPPAYGTNSGQGFAPPAGPPPGQSYAPPSGPPPKA